MQKLWGFLTLFSFCFMAGAGSQAATIFQEGFDNYDTGTRPVGWSFIGCDANSDTYTSSSYVGIAAPSIKLDNTGDQVVTQTFSNPSTLNFWIRCSSSSTSSFLIEEYGESSWSTITNVTALPTTGTNFSNLALNPSSSQLRFTYTKITGNLAFDDVGVQGATTTILTTTTAGSTTTTTVSTTISTGSTTSASTTTLLTTTTAHPCGEIYEGFDDYETGVRPAGWSFIGCSANSDTYTTTTNSGITPPSIKLDNTGDQIVTSSFGTCSYELSFWIKGISTDPNSALLVEEFYTSSWSLMTTIWALPTSGTVMSGFQLNPSSSQLRFTYAKTGGNLAFDDFTLIPPPSPSPSPTPTLTPPATSTPTIPPTATPTVTPEGYKTPPPTPTLPPTTTPSPTMPPTATPSPTAPCGPESPDDYYVLGGSDYNGDGYADVAIYRPSLSLWKVRDLTSIYFGKAGDRPVPADYDGDGKTDFAYWRNGLWSIRDISRFYFGTSADRPVPGDYDGDGLDEAAFYRPGIGLWKARGVTRIYTSHEDEDFSVPARYSAQPQKLPGIFRSSQRLWIIPGLTRLYFGKPGDWPAPGDYDGSGVEDIAIFRPSVGLWKVRWITRIYQSPSCHALPVQADYDGDGTTVPGIFIPELIRWEIMGEPTIYFGNSSDIPISR